MIESSDELRKVVSFINDQLELKEDLETLFPGSVEILQGSQKLFNVLMNNHWIQEIEIMM